MVDDFEIETNIFTSEKSKGASINIETNKEIKNIKIKEVNELKEIQKNTNTLSKEILFKKSENSKKFIDKLKLSYSWLKNGMDRLTVQDLAKKKHTHNFCKKKHDDKNKNYGVATNNLFGHILTTKTFEIDKVYDDSRTLLVNHYNKFSKMIKEVEKQYSEDYRLEILKCQKIKKGKKYEYKINWNTKNSSYLELGEDEGFCFALFDSEDKRKNVKIKGYFYTREHNESFETIYNGVSKTFFYKFREPQIIIASVENIKIEECMKIIE